MNEQALRVHNTEANVEASQPAQALKELRSGIFAKARVDGNGWGLVLVGFEGDRRPVMLTDGAVVGTAAKDAPIKGKGIAEEHVRVIVRADGCYLDDLDSPEGTYVNGVRARRIGLTHGDVVRLGGTIGIFVERGLSTYAGHSLRTGTLVHGPRQRKEWIDPIFDLVKDGSSVCIEGAPGTGKRTIAHLAAALREEVGDVVTVDGSVESKASVLTSTQPATWIVLNADRLPRAQQLEIAHALGRIEGLVVIATVSQPLDRAISDGHIAPWFGAVFSGKRVTITPLEQRREDLPSIIRDIADRRGIAVERVTPEVLDALLRAGWPGGVPQLEATLVAAAEATDANAPIDLFTVTSTLTRANRIKSSLPQAADPSLARARLEDALARASGSVASAARSLGMSRQAIYREADRLGLDIARRKASKS